ncbi:MAG: hypothetical protein KAJ40_01100 [Alphaproteobacteria bacterium]|nr:hypothetical protein [Alphaproteobacteria bacterium]
MDSHFDSFLLEYITKDYADKSEKTFKQTVNYLEKDKITCQKVVTAYEAFNECMMVYPITTDNFLSGERIPIIEAEETNEILLFQVFSGMYKLSFQLLREILELVLLQFHLYFEDDKKYLRNWLNGDVNTPFKREMKKALHKSEAYKLANPKFNLDSQLDIIYKSLSGYIHTQGIKYSHKALKNSNRPVFSEKSLIKFTDIYFDTIKYGISLIAINFPNAIIPLPIFAKFGYNAPFSFIDEQKVHKIRSIFTKAELLELEDLASKNESFLDLKSSVENMPDLTHDEIIKTSELSDLRVSASPNAVESAIKASNEIDEAKLKKL